MYSVCNEISVLTHLSKNRTAPGQGEIMFLIYGSEVNVFPMRIFNRQTVR